MGAENEGVSGDLSMFSYQTSGTTRHPRRLSGLLQGVWCLVMAGNVWCEMLNVNVWCVMLKLHQLVKSTPTVKLP